MKVLMLSIDPHALEENSAFFSKHMSYASRFTSLTIIVLTRRIKKKALHVGKLSVIPTNSYTRLISLLDALWRGVRVPKPDVITAQDPFETGFIGLLLAWYWRVPLHLQVHTDFLDPNFIRNSTRNHIRAMLGKWLLHRACRVRVVSERIKQSLQMLHLSCSISVIPIFIDVNRFADHSSILRPQTPVSLLYVGRLEHEKNVDLALQSLTTARAAGHDARLTIVGRGREESRLRNLAIEMGVDKHTTFVGWQDDPRAFYAQSDLLLVTSDFEGYGMVIVEALATGIPVLSTDVGVAREMGALIASPESFPAAVIEWIISGQRQAKLLKYEFNSLDEYSEMITNDIRACILMDKVL